MDKIETTTRLPSDQISNLEEQCVFGVIRRRPNKPGLKTLLPALSRLKVCEAVIPGGRPKADVMRALKS